MTNQNPEQVARDKIDAQLAAFGWAVQDNTAIDFHIGQGQAVREYTTDTGPADYVLFVDKKPVDVITRLARRNNFKSHFLRPNQTLRSRARSAYNRHS